RFSPGPIPPGLMFSNDGVLSGIPGEGYKDYQIRVRITDNNKLVSTRSIPLVIYGSSGINNTEIQSFTQNVYPNPFHDFVKWDIDMPSFEPVNIKIYNSLGQLIITLFGQAVHFPCRQQISWNGKDQSGTLVPSGVYFYRMTTGCHSHEGKLLKN
ncbi:MAG: T9SS type A sorting domain-containing protein, partial [Bacteroidetes bacterium]|nr:T9SS type A sorting domain-containing protein [Bacteroidota bacterium]